MFGATGTVFGLERKRHTYVLKLYSYLQQSPHLERSGEISLSFASPKQNAHTHTQTQAVFPGRLEVVVGDSRETVPAYGLAEEAADRDPHICNVVFVDGDHTEEGAYADFINLQALTSR